jgi:hypothetical protein
VVEEVLHLMTAKERERDRVGEKREGRREMGEVQGQNILLKDIIPVTCFLQLCPIS